MESLGPGDDRTSPALSTRSLDLRRLSARADSAYSSFSAASGGREPHPPSPGTGLLPYLDWEYVRVVWGGSAPAAVLRTSPQPRPAAAVRSGPRPAEVRGTPGPLNRHTTPLLYALTAEAEAAARAAELPSPPASRAAYRQRLQGAQRRVLRETSFQRKELRMSLPARLRPSAPARPPAAHPRSASLSHPGGEVESARSGASAPETGGRGTLADQQRRWCFSEPGRLDRVGQGGGGLVGEGGGEVGSSSRLPGPQEHRESQEHGALAGLGGAETPRPLFKTRLHSTKSFFPGHCGQYGAPASRVLNQKEAAVACLAEGLQSTPAAGVQGVSESYMASSRLPSFPDNEVFLEETPLVRMRALLHSHVPPGLPTSVHASDQQYGAGLGQRADHATVPQEHSLNEHPEIAVIDDCWQGINGSVGVSRSCCGPPGTASGDIPTFDPTGLLTTDPHTAAESDPFEYFPVDTLGPPGNDSPETPAHIALAWGTGQPGSRSTWSSPHLEELVQELARLDPSLSDTINSYPSPESPVGLLDGLIPLTEVRAAMRPDCGETGEEATGTSESGPENLSTHPVPDQPCGQGLPEPNNSIQVKKVELAHLLQKMLQVLQAEQKQLQGAAQEWARRGAALEAAVGQACAPHELERFSGFMADLERVLGLLLLLGSRLDRVRGALARAGTNCDPEEQASLLQRLGLLERQQEDAKELKEHVARRERALREVLGRTLSAAELHAYSALLAGKAAVLAQQRSLDERVRLLQDQLDAVRSDLGHPPPPPRPT
ncbi:hypothetical protein MC885_016055 [Smutsia gigantea]|nr:hypothetical protein MC885_016055 [Smutsia gigantea]